MRFSPGVWLAFTYSCEHNSSGFAIWVLGICDPLAGYVGQHYADKKVYFLYEENRGLVFCIFIAAMTISCFSWDGQQQCWYWHWYRP
ncbi:MAG: hypothetical protein IPP49_20215 [Saprospiraceae bacterium]|nr:hypothetical protein [Saprospiraceae bacterium]